MIKNETGLYGGEPRAQTIDKNTSEYTVSLITSLNWYSYNKNNDDARKYLLDHIKKELGKESYALASESRKTVDSTVGWLARLSSQGAILNDKHVSEIQNAMNDLLTPEVKKKKVVVKDDSTPKFNIQEAIEDKARTFIGEYLEAALDSNFKDFDLLSTMKQLNVPGPYLRWITPWVDKKLEQHEYAYETDITGYEFLGKIELRKMVKALKTYKEDLESYLKVKKAARKPRTTKKKSPYEIVKNLKYLKEFPTLGLKSVYPQEIIGANALWVYNTKLRKLGVYRAADADGLSVKGTTILNYKPDESIQKTLRKPEEVIPSMLACGKIAQRKFLNDVKAVDTELSGRIGEDIILLKVY